MKTTAYFSLGQDHAHMINNTILDKRCIIEIYDENPRQKIFELFNDKWAFEYNYLSPSKMRYFTRGIYNIEKHSFNKTNDFYVAKIKFFNIELIKSTEEYKSLNLQENTIYICRYNQIDNIVEIDQNGVLFHFNKHFNIIE